MEVSNFFAFLTFRAHLCTDLRPYSCIFEKCSDPNQLFETRDEWLQHEVLDHQEWWCDISHGRDLSIGVFWSEHGFTEHMCQEHFGSFSEG
jgi:hypothetical protein